MKPPSYGGSGRWEVIARASHFVICGPGKGGVSEATPHAAGQGKNFEHARHIWAYVGGRREDCPKPCTTRVGQYRKVSQNLPHLAGIGKGVSQARPLWACQITPYRSICGQRKGGVPAATAHPSGTRQSSSEHALFRREKRHVGVIRSLHCTGEKDMPRT